MYLTLKLVNGEELECEVKANTCVIGRSAKCDVVVPHEGMSRQHCQIELEDGEIFVTDLGSTNGVLIDGQKIEPHAKTPYQTFLTLSFGAVQSLQVELEESRAEAKSLKVSGGGHHKAETHTSSQKTSFINKETGKSATSPGTTNPNTKISKASKEEKSKSIFVNILAVAILVAAVVWYIQKEEEAPEETTQSAPSSPGKTNNYDSF